MPGGWMIGLGQGIANAGDAFAKAKQEAIDRMLRERSLDMQQRQLEEQIRGGEFNDAYKMMTVLPGGTPVDENAFGPGGTAAVRALSRVQMAPDQSAPTLGAKSLPMTTAAPTLDAPDPTKIQAPAPVVGSQDLSPKIQQRVSIPTEDARYRAAMMADYTRNRIADQNVAARLQIANAKNQLAQAIMQNTDAYRAQLLKQGWQRLDQMEQAIQQTGTYQNAQMNNMDYDNQLGAYLAQYGHPSNASSGDDPFKMAIAKILSDSMTPGGATPGGAAGVPVPGVTPAPPKPPRPNPPQPAPVRGHSGVKVDPAVAPDQTPGASDYDEYLRRKKAGK